MVGTDSKKINIPYGLCVQVGPDDCGDGGCFHCLVNDAFYRSMDECKSKCNTSSSTSPPTSLPAP